MICAIAEGARPTLVLRPTIVRVTILRDAVAVWGRSHSVHNLRKGPYDRWVAEAAYHVGA